jgi:hypothetical protein
MSTEGTLYGTDEAFIEDTPQVPTVNEAKEVTMSNQSYDKTKDILIEHGASDLVSKFANTSYELINGVQTSNTKAPVWSVDYTKGGQGVPVLRNSETGFSFIGTKQGTGDPIDFYASLSETPNTLVFYGAFGIYTADKNTKSIVRTVSFSSETRTDESGTEIPQAGDVYVLGFSEK